MFAIEDWSKEKVHTVMREVLFSFNYMWFLMEAWAKQHCPEKVQGEEFQRLSDEFGRYQAQRLEKVVDDKLTGVARLAAFVRHSHWCAFEEIELTPLSDHSLRMRTLGCTAQKAARKWGLSHYDCGQSGLRLRTGFFRGVIPTAQVERVFTPPDEKPAGTPAEAACEWIITI
jgi:hypothetical protein